MREARASQRPNGQWTVAEYEDGKLISTSGTVASREVAVQVVNYINRKAMGEAQPLRTMRDLRQEFLNACAEDGERP